MLESLSAALSFVLVQLIRFNCSRMRVLRVFLLIGGIACFPQQQGSGGQPWWWVTSSSGQAPSNPSDYKPAGQLSGPGSYPGLYYSGTNTAGGDGRSYYGVQQQSSSPDSQHGGPGSSGPYQSTEESWSTSSDTDGEDEPVFTPVEDEDQVYALKSRNRYNVRRMSVSQFRYTPTEPRFPQDSVFPHPGKGLQPQLPGMEKY